MEKIKLIVFLGLIVVTLLLSFITSWLDKKKNKRKRITVLKSLFIIVGILGLGIVWWVITETDGISQGIGAMIYAGSMAGIFLLNTLYVVIVNKNHKK